MKRKANADKAKERVASTENVERHPIDFIKMMDSEDIPQPTKFPHCKMELAVVRFESGKYYPSKEKDKGLKAAAMIPIRTLLAARNGKESTLLIHAIVAPEAPIAIAKPIFRFTKGVMPP